MWQRIQTVFLAITILALLISLVQPVWVYTGGESGDSAILTPFYLLQNGTYQYMPFSLTAILSVAAATMAFTSIRKYKNRVLQMKLGAFNSLFLAGVIGSSLYFAMALMKQFQGGQYGLGFFLPAVSVICNLIANFFIRKDERLVRDSGRLR